MWKYYLKFSLRSLQRSKYFTIINVFGLALGIGCSTVLYLTFVHETTFDQHHQNYERLYRVVSEIRQEGEIETSPSPASYYPMSKALLNDFPEIENAALVYKQSTNIKVNHNNQINHFKVENGLEFVEPSFLELVDIQWVSGDKTTALSNPNSVVLTLKMIKKYFGFTHEQAHLAVNRTIEISNEDYNITGVIEDYLPNTDFAYDILVSFSSFRGNEYYDDNSWEVSDTYLQCFLTLRNQVDIDNLNSKLRESGKRYFGSMQNRDVSFSLQPIKEMHFDDRYYNLETQSISRLNLSILLYTGVLLVVIACANFINMATAISLRRSKHLGIQSVLGAKRHHGLIKSIMESTIVTTLGLGLSLVITQLLINYLGSSQNLLQEGVYLHFSYDIVSYLLIVLVSVSLLSGLIPNLLTSRLKFPELLSNKSTGTGTKGIWVRRSFVVLQFGIAQILVIAALIMTSQNNYFTNKDLGYVKEGVVNILLPEVNLDQKKAFRNELLKNPKILNVSLSQSAPSRVSNLEWDQQMYYYRDAEKINGSYSLKLIDENYLDTYEIELMAGSAIRSGDSTQRSVLVNEAMLDYIGIENAVDAIGVRLGVFGGEWPIAGVVSNFHAQSLHQKIEPFVLAKLPNYFFEAGVKIQDNNFQESLGFIEATYNNMFPESHMDYSVLDEVVNGYYTEESNKSSLTNLFSVIAIFISCLGVLGLLSNIIAQRLREIGIRKVLGASRSHILLLFSKDFMILIGISFLIASPIALLVMNDWLDAFTYKISVTPTFFIVSLLLMTILTGLLIGIQSFLATRVNPTQLLRDE